MRLIFTFLILGLAIACANPAQATKPCEMPPKDEFTTETIKPAGLIVGAKILDYEESNGTTDVEVLEVFYNAYDEDVPEELNIVNWVAYRPPLFIYEINDEILLYLNRATAELAADYDEETASDSYEIVNLSWADCVPGITGYGADIGIVKGYENNGGDDQYIDREEFRKLIQDIKSERMN